MADKLTSLGQPTIGLRRYGWNTSKEGSLRRKTKNKVEEIQLANLGSLGSLATNQVLSVHGRTNRNPGTTIGDDVKKETYANWPQSFSVVYKN